MKLKSTFSGAESYKEKRNCVFYSEVSPTQDLENLEDSTSPESDENTVIDNQSVIDLSVSPKNFETQTIREHRDVDELSADFSPEEDSEPFIIGSVSTQYEVLPFKKFGSPNRPDNLDLIDDNGYPVRPPRHIKKKIREKRAQRLLSVPNIKFQKTEMQSYKDLRNREDTTAVSPQPSFAGNLMRRFSKF